MTYEATAINGTIQLPEEVHLPENAKVFVVVPESGPFRVPRIMSPHLAHPEQIVDFQMEVWETEDAGIQRD